ncbi:GntR family transcriptional regulator [Acuticoccus sp. I52.16.1]|uniref:GntR family transcriptional regulator n=1 Tax=Acuticoccus sp. I52.16.1 TaxID=2928472 RepID=UPI001FD05A00|nr:GntR family transcriptional regulator [Acuticoccus sp. I52.16.1]UOM35792.1 GntR family transcriptional regulator [Acuticoccus sp. I52.16.1]
MYSPRLDGESDILAKAPGTSAYLPTSARVFDELRARIVALDLAPGMRLSRPDLAKAFGVSQSPVREALQRLETLGLVATYRQSRTEVTHIDQAMVRHEQFFRTGIECEVVNRLAGLGDTSGLLEARGILKMSQALADDSSQIDLFRRLDEDFHRALFMAAGQEALHALVLERTSQMARLRTLDLPSAGKMQSVLEGHGAVLAAIEAGDRHGATDAMRRHLSGTIERMPAIVAQQPDFFVPAP